MFLLSSQHTFLSVLFNNELCNIRCNREILFHATKDRVIEVKFSYVLLISALKSSSVMVCGDVGSCYNVGNSYKLIFINCFLKVPWWPQILLMSCFRYHFTVTLHLFYLITGNIRQYNVNLPVFKASQQIKLHDFTTKLSFCLNQLMIRHIIKLWF